MNVWLAFDDNANAFDQFESRTEAIRAAIKHRLEWSPFVLVGYDESGHAIEAISDEELDGADA